MKKLFKIVSLSLVCLTLIGGLFYLFFNEPLPSGKKGKEADALAKKMLASLNYKAYEDTRYLEWSFRRDHFYKWDKKNNTAIVTWSDNEILIDTKNPEKSKVIKPENVSNKDELISDAFSYFNNDSFWLVAPYKVFDQGTERRLVTYKGKESLLITYTSGGTTPGDSYLWILNENGFPQSFKMWVKIIPIGGLEVAWSDWEKVTSGVLLPSKHEFPIGTINMGTVRGFN